MFSHSAARAVFFVTTFAWASLVSSPAQSASAAPNSAILAQKSATEDSSTDETTNDPSSWIGFTLTQAISTWGAPKAVYAVRGPESWQDDVVFEYDGLDLYWYRDRIWQVRVASAYGLRAGDTSETAMTLLGEPLHRFDEALVYQLSGKAWPLRLRVGFDDDDRVVDLYVYRADF